MNLSHIKDGATAYVTAIKGSPSLRVRLEELGFVPGQEVTRVYATPSGSPVIYAMLGQRVALRTGEAQLIEVSTQRPNENYADEQRVARTAAETSAAAPLPSGPIVPATGCATESCGGCPGCGPRKPLAPKAEGTITVALVGNPNCGKTTVFNALSGGHERTGNYAGVTVASVVGETHIDGRTVRFVDLPGTYSLRAYSPEEAYVMSELLKGEIDAVINVLDVNNLERNLLLTLQVRRLGLPMVGALNLWDEFSESGSTLDVDRLSAHMGMRFVPCVASRGEGLKALAEAVIEAYDRREEQPTPPPNDPHSAADPHALVHHYLADIYRLRESKAVRFTTWVDRFLVKNPLSYGVFFLVILLVFWATFTIGQYPMNWMQAGVTWLTETLTNVLPKDRWYVDLLASGVVGGVGTVIVFLPQILILYFFISILEDSGYLARTALLFDPLLRRVGLHGKHQATWVLFSLYCGGIVMALLSAWLLSHFIRRHDESHFVMEIPPYRCPVAQSVVSHTWEKGRQYLRKMGGVILVASIVVWILGYFPHPDRALSPLERQEQSYLGQAGHLIQPAIAPLGFDWRMGVGLLTGAAAKELMVSTLGVLYHMDEDSAAAAGSGNDAKADRAISAALREATSPAAALSYMVFALLYFPCLATIAAIRGESGQWKYAVLSMLYTTGVAYVAAWLTFHIARLCT